MKKQRLNKGLWQAAICAFLIALIFFSGYQYYQIQQHRLDQLKRNELITIATLKIDQISAWYADELEDAAIITLEQDFTELIANCVSEPNFTQNNKFLNQISSITKEHNYKYIHILSPSLNLIYSTDKSLSEIDSTLLIAAHKTLTQKAIFSTDLYKCSHHQLIHFDITAPIFDIRDNIIAIAIFSIDPEKFLYPLIQKWPLPSETAETALIRKDNGKVTFLNELRHEKSTALALSISLENKNVPAVYAALGNKGIFEGIDYRNEKVVAYVDSVPGTPWYVVSKIDTAELAEASGEMKVFLIILVSCVSVLVLIVFALLLIWSQRNNFKKLWLSQQEFKTTLYSIGDAVITTDSEGKVKQMNTIAEQLTGWKENEAKMRPIEEVFKITNEDTGQPADNPVEKVVKSGAIVGLANHTLLASKDGIISPIADSGAPIFNKNGEIDGVVLVFRDQSKERKTQFQLEESKRQLFTLLSNLQGMAFRCSNSLDWTMEFVSKGCLELTGYSDYELIQNKIESFGNLIHPDDQVMVWETVQQALLNNSNYELEYRIKNRNGRTVWVWEKGQGVYDEHGALQAIEGFIADVSERKMFENALKSSEKLFQALAENSSVGIFRTNSKGLTTYVNPKWCELCDSTPNEAMNNGWVKKLHPDDTEALVKNWDQAVSNKQRSVAEYRFVHSNGTIKWVKGEAVPEINETGELMGYIGTIADITQSKNAEEKLIHSNSLLRTIIDNIPDLVYMKDTDGRKLLANKADYETQGAKSENDILGKTDFDFYPKEIAELLWSDDLSVIKSGQSIINREEKIVDQKGKTKWLWTSKIPFKDHNGKVVGLVGIGHDVTQRKKDQAEMVRLSTAITQSPVSIVITDTLSNIVFVNPKFTEITGFQAEEVLGKNPRILKSGTQPLEFYENMYKTIGSGQSWKSEIQNKKKSGELYWEQAIISPILNSEGEIINYIAIKEDITERKKMMQELILATEKAVESDRLKTSFLANMSHEIRTPLNSILGFTSFLTTDDSLTAEEKEEFAGIINKSADGLLQIINDIIDISSLETGQLRMVKYRFNPAQTVEATYKLFSTKLLERNKPELEIRVIPFSGSVEIETDENRLMQIFNNLVGNAIKFTSKGHIEFGIVKVENGFVHFKVEDTGSGIEKRMQGVVFDRFRQVDDAITRSKGGNGLGLSIVKSLVELMGGSITLESEMGKGSTFSFKIPVAK